MINPLRHRLLASFLDDRQGQVALTFGIAVLPMLIVTGAAVDYSRAVAQRSNLQQATDATVLAIAHSYLSAVSTSATLTVPTQTYLTGALNAIGAGTTPVSYGGVTAPVNTAVLEQITLSNNNTQMCIQTGMIVQNAIMTIVNQPYAVVGANACSQVGQTYEVALVLDNSGSMAESAGGQSKMAALITAASQLVDTLVPSSNSAPSTAMSIVPFTALVNVGTNTTASFLDTQGTNSLHWQNFHRPIGTAFIPTSKLDLFSGMTNTTWGGCVEERPYPYISTDTAASQSNPNTMFVPFLSPDDPGPVDNSYGYACYPNNSYCGYTLQQGGPPLFFNSYLGDNGSSSAGGICSTSAAYANADNVTGTGSDGTVNKYPGASMTMVCKYKGASATMLTESTGIKTGPNYLCSSQQLTPLTTSNSTLKNAISSMVAGGSTDLATGFMWGWRTISPVVAPFPTASILPVGPQNPKAYAGNTPKNTKIIILMTDGFNSWTSNPYNTQWASTYEAFGYYTNNRLSNYASNCGGSTTTASTARCQMDAVTLEACSNAKNSPSNVVIYTVGFTVSSDPIDQEGINLLKSCASDSSKYFQATDGTTIVAAFQQIAASIQNLRLSQ